MSNDDLKLNLHTWKFNNKQISSIESEDSHTRDYSWIFKKENFLSSHGFF